MEQRSDAPPAIGDSSLTRDAFAGPSQPGSPAVLDQARDSIRPTLLAALDIVVEILVAAGLFVTLAVPAVLLNAAIDWAQKKFQLGPGIVYPLVAAEHLLLLADLALFFVFLWSAFQKAWSRV